MNKNDWIGLIAIAIMLIGACIITYQVTTTSINKCTADPIKYSANQLAGEGNYTYIIFKVFKNKGDVMPISSREIDLTPNYLTMP